MESSEKTTTNNNKKTIQWGEEENILYQVSQDYQKGIDLSKKWPFIPNFAEKNKPQIITFPSIILPGEMEDNIIDFILTILALLPLPVKFENMKDKSQGIKNHKVHLFKSEPTFRQCYFYYKSKIDSEGQNCDNVKKIIEWVYKEMLKQIQTKIDTRDSVNSVLENQKKTIQATFEKGEKNPYSVISLILKTVHSNQEIYIPLSIFDDNNLAEIFHKIKSSGKKLLLAKKKEIFNNEPYHILEDDGTIKKSLLDQFKLNDLTYKDDLIQKKQQKQKSKIYDSDLLLINDTVIEENNDVVSNNYNKPKKDKKDKPSNQKLEVKSPSNGNGSKTPTKKKKLETTEPSNDLPNGKFKLKEDMYVLALDFMSKLLETNQSSIGIYLSIIDQTRKKIDSNKKSILCSNFQSANARDNGEVIISMMMRAFDVDNFQDLSIILEMLDKIKDQCVLY
jgi:hypothetical protein